MERETKIELLRIQSLKFEHEDAMALCHVELIVCKLFDRNVGEQRQIAGIAEQTKTVELNSYVN